MAIKLVQVRRKGEKNAPITFLPETALRFFPDYVKTPSQKAREEVPDGTAFPAAVDGADDTTPTATSSASTTTKEK